MMMMMNILHILPHGLSNKQHELFTKIIQHSQHDYSVMSWQPCTLYACFIEVFKGESFEKKIVQFRIKFEKKNRKNR